MKQSHIITEAIFHSKGEPVVPFCLIHPMLQSNSAEAKEAYAKSNFPIVLSPHINEDFYIL